MLVFAAFIYLQDFRVVEEGSGAGGEQRERMVRDCESFYLSLYKYIISMLKKFNY